jgi:hypothetical protein
MTDKELLELAAKAAGEELKYDSFGAGDNPDREYNYWNPLIDDTDALRLAVKLGMAVSVCTNYTVILGVVDDIGFIKEVHNDDPYAATRRAIVRAAAEIGRGME